MKRFPSLLILIALAIWGTAHAGPFDVTLNCAFPTTNTDTTPLTDLAGIKVYGGTSGKLLATVPKASGCTWTETNTTPSAHSYNITAFNAAGTESVHSSNVSIDTTPPPPPPSVPNPPTNLKATTPGVPNTAYSVIKTDGRLSLLPVGTIPPETACDGSQGVLKDGRSFYVVPTSAVKWSGNVRTLAVVASCG